MNLTPHTNKPSLTEKARLTPLHKERGAKADVLSRFGVGVRSTKTIAYD